MPGPAAPRKILAPRTNDQRAAAVLARQGDCAVGKARAARRRAAAGTQRGWREPLPRAGVQLKAEGVARDHALHKRWQMLSQWGMRTG